MKGRKLNLGLRRGGGNLLKGRKLNLGLGRGGGNLLKGRKLNLGLGRGGGNLLKGRKLNLGLGKGVEIIETEETKFQVLNLVFSLSINTPPPPTLTPIPSPKFSFLYHTVITMTSPSNYINIYLTLLLPMMLYQITLRLPRL